MGQVAILGGIFDPVHWGHLLIAETAVSQVGLESVIWVPARYPPHKQVCGYEHRRLMVESAIASNPAFILSPREMSHTSPDYAIATLLNLQDAYPNRQWYWIIGMDAFQTLPQWYRREQLIPSCNWLVAPRPLPLPTTAALLAEGGSQKKEMVMTEGSKLCQQVTQQLASQHISIRWQLLEMPQIGISSSLIRQYRRRGDSIRYLVPEEVRAYITTHNLYLEAEVRSEE